MKEVNIEYVQNLYPIFTKPKRIKIIVGGRGSAKSTGVCDYVVTKLSIGELWCCARENLNSIDESVHRTLLDEIDRLEIGGFTATRTSVSHLSGGRTFYRGLSRNITSLKSTLSGIDGLLIEEGEDITDNTLRVLTASVRLNAKDSERLLAGEDVKTPEIIIIMNRGRRDGAIAKKWLSRADKELARCGYYEDDALMVVEMNYTDMPEEWFMASGLEVERLDDLEKLSQAAYDHKWGGHYLDEVENAIVKGEWFDACVDAHKLPKFKKMFEPHGCKKAIHDPFDDGNDAASYVLTHGSIVLKVSSKTSGEIDECCDWATGQAINDNADWFIWDYDGMGTGLKRQVSIAFKGTHTKFHGFRGSLSGRAQDNADTLYQGDYNSEDDRKPKKYQDTFKNNRAQYYILLANRIFNTYRCVVKGHYVDPDDMISFDSEGIENIIDLRSQLTRVPRVANATGLEQIMNKKEMKSNGIDSPNEGDGVMMSGFMPPTKRDWGPINYDNTGIV